MAGTRRRWLVGGAVVVAVVVAGAVAVAVRRADEPAPATCAAGPDRLVVTAVIGDGVLTVEELRRDQAPVDLTPDWIASDPAISPDGTRLVVNRAIGDSYESGGPEAEELWVLDLDGGHPRQLTSGNTAILPTWSPDGTQIAYLGLGNDRGPEGYLAVRAADGSGAARHLLDLPLHGSDGAVTPVFTADGDRIVFGQGHRVRAVGLDGTGPTTVATLDHQVVDVTLDPGGATATVTVRDDDIGSSWRLVRVDLATGATTDLGPGSQARWSSDGRHLYLFDPEPGPWRLRVADGHEAPLRPRALGPDPPLDPRSAGFGTEGLAVTAC